jgi:nitrogen-specific signal transduction histidine kinase/HD-like signal output (HDOD) protein
MLLSTREKSGKCLLEENRDIAAMHDVNDDTEILSNLENYPPLCMPQVLVELLEACLEQESLPTFGEIVMQDAALTARIVQTAVKSGVHLDATEPVSSALQSLDISILTSLALQAARQVLGHGLSGDALFFQYQLWFRAKVGGIAARCLAPSVNYPYVEEAQLGGVLLNFGIQTLFARNHRYYLELNMPPWSDISQISKEKNVYGIDHLSLTDALISRWNLDSFLLDSLSFLHADVNHIEQSCTLLKIVRLAHQFCREPLEPCAEFTTLSQRLFTFSGSEATYLFEWARGLYADFAALITDPEALRADFTSALERLKELAFIVAEQETARSRLAACGDLQSTVAVARNLYLENSSAHEVLFLYLDQKNNQLIGIPEAGQSRMVADLKIPLGLGRSLVSDAVLMHRGCHSKDGGKVLTVSDQLLKRLTGKQEIVCLPLSVDGQPLGAVVLGLAGEQISTIIESLKLKVLARVIAAALAQTSSRMNLALGDSGSVLWRVSHEINNPLTVITNYAEILKQSLQGTANAELPETIKKEVRRVADVVDYYLQDQNSLAIPERDVDLNQLVQETLDALRDSLFEAKNIRVELVLQPALARVATNALLVGQILVNLLRNAAASVSSGALIKVETRSCLIAQQGHFAEIVVRDNGPGISDHILEKLFQPVVKTKETTYRGGGLNIVKSLVDDLGGQISCHSSDGQGTDFHLLIPFFPALSRGKG